jgi:importin-5
MGYQPTDELLRLDRQLSQSPSTLLSLDRRPFMRLMSDLVSNSNTKRAHAEQSLLYLSENHPALLCHKTLLLLCSSRSETRFMSAILLRQFLTPASDFYVWPRLSAFCQFYLRIILLLALEEENIRHVANAKSDTIAELASNLVPLHPQYPELLRFVLVRMAIGEPPVLVEASLRIFARIAKPLADMLVPLIPTQRSVLSICITHPTSFDVRMAALSAFCSLVQSLRTPADRNKLQNLLTLLHRVIIKAPTENEITVVPKVLEQLIDLAGAEPNFFRNFIKDTNIVLDILAVAENDQLEEGTRHLALEFVITLAEARKPSMGTSSILSFFFSMSVIMNKPFLIQQYMLNINSRSV